MTLAAPALLLLAVITPAHAQDALLGAFMNPPAPGVPFIGDVEPETPLRSVADGFDVRHTLIFPDRAATYVIQPSTRPAEIRSLMIRAAALGRHSSFASEMPDGTAVTDQPYWPSSAGLATIHARLAAMIDAGTRMPTVAVVEPWVIIENAEDWELEAFRNVTNYLAAIQVGFNVFDDIDLQLCSEPPEPPVKAVFLPRATLSADSVGAIGALVDKGVKVIAYGDVPSVDEDQQATIEEIFGVASVDDVEEPIVQKGNAVLVPAELTRLNAMLNGMRCEDLFLYPPWPSVVSARFAGNADPTRDWYLLHNTSDAACHTYLTLYRRCVPEIWNIDSGTVHIAPGYKYTEDDTTLLPLVLESQDAIVLMCTPAVPEAEDTHIIQAPGLERVAREDKNGSVTVTGLARLNGGHTVMLADRRKAKTRVEGLPPELLVDGAWSFATTTPFNRQASQITKARVRAERPGDDPSGWSAPDLDDTIWDLATIGEDLPALAPKWHAKWLASNGHDTTRYFRKSLELGQAAKSATLTVTADNAYVVFLNGEQLGEDGTWIEAETYDIADKLSRERTSSLSASGMMAPKGPSSPRPVSRSPMANSFASPPTTLGACPRRSPMAGPARASMPRRGPLPRLSALPPPRRRGAMCPDSRPSRTRVVASGSGSMSRPAPPGSTSPARRSSVHLSRAKRRWRMEARSS